MQITLQTLALVTHKKTKGSFSFLIIIGVQYGQRMDEARQVAPPRLAVCLAMSERISHSSRYNSLQKSFGFDWFTPIFKGKKNHAFMIAMPTMNE
jgi:hypothetical protein